MIYINLLGKKKISIIVNINDKILDLKKEIENNEKIDIDELLSNCDKTEGREVEVPKVVG